jgi:hypothetical protein
MGGQLFDGQHDFFSAQICIYYATSCVIIVVIVTYTTNLGIEFWSDMRQKCHQLYQQNLI